MVSGLTCETMLPISPVLAGNKTVFPSLAMLPNADTYCSATLYDTALTPFCNTKDKRTIILQAKQYLSVMCITDLIIFRFYKYQLNGKKLQDSL